MASSPSPYNPPSASIIYSRPPVLTSTSLLDRNNLESFPESPNEEISCGPSLPTSSLPSSLASHQINGTSSAATYLPSTIKGLEDGGMGVGYPEGYIPSAVSYKISLLDPSLSNRMSGGGGGIGVGGVGSDVGLGIGIGRGNGAFPGSGLNISMSSSLGGTGLSGGLGLNGLTEISPLNPNLGEDSSSSKTGKKTKKFLRAGGGEIWEDPTLAEWDKSKDSESSTPQPFDLKAFLPSPVLTISHALLCLL